MEVATGLLDDNHELVSNRTEEGNDNHLKVGICIDHPFIQHLIHYADSETRGYFALTYLASQLAANQQKLVPDTPFTHFVKRNLNADMRSGLIQTLCEQKAIA